MFSLQNNNDGILKRAIETSTNNINVYDMDDGNGFTGAYLISKP